MNRSSLIMTLVMLVIFVALVSIASGYPANARFMPFVVGLPAIGLCLLQLVLDVRERRRVTVAADPRNPFKKAEEAVSRIAGRPVEFEVAREQPAAVVETDRPLEGEIVRRELVLWGYFLGFVAGILLFGFWVAIPVFLVSFLRFQAGSSWRTSLVLGVVASIALFFIFEKGLRVTLHPGFVSEYFSGQP
jgi:Tripartite tricarboxylate transporter TctB family